MQKDMHYYAIYFLCLAAGFNPDEAFETAFSSQYVDDSLHDRVVTLQCQDGDIKDFRPMRTAHNGFESLGEGVQEEVYFPFHFLPGLDEEKDSYEEKIVTKAGAKGKLFNVLLDNVIAGNKNFIKLGINLHVLADTFSHENFSGRWSNFNNIRKVSFIPVKRSWVSALVSKIGWKINSKTLFNLAPAIGHGRAGKLPDIPHLCWSYQKFSGELEMVSNNLKFYSGMFILYKNLLCKLGVGNPRLSSEEVKSILWEAVFFNSRLSKRCKFWRKKIKKHFISNITIKPEYLKYKSDYWIKKIGLKWKFIIFDKTKIQLKVTKEEFKESYLNKFYRECLAHKKFVLKELHNQLKDLFKQEEITENVFVSSIKESFQRQIEQSY